MDELEEHVDPLLLHVAVDDQAGDAAGELLLRPPGDPLGAGVLHPYRATLCHTGSVLAHWTFGATPGML